MENRFLLVDKQILPDYYEKVIEARNLISSGKVKDVSEATRCVGISRSTYYKYKDYVFDLNADTECRRAIIAFTLLHKAGVLGDVLGKLSECGANILTITQNLPINSQAHVVLSLDISCLTVDMATLVSMINKTNGAFGAKLISIE